MCLTLAVASQQKYVDHFPFDYEAARAHELQPHRHMVPVRGVNLAFAQIQLTLIVSPQGNVTESRAGGDREALKFWPALKKEVDGWKFKPFEHNGKPVIAEVEDYMNFMPPERFPTRHVRPPVLAPSSAVEITLQRTGCYGTCPSYTVTLNQTGIRFIGRAFVAQTGEHTAAIDASAAHALAQKFVDADFYSMEDVYRSRITDNPTYVLTISIDGQTKHVEDYVGSQRGMPLIITTLEDDVDRVANTARWIKK